MATKRSILENRVTEPFALFVVQSAHTDIGYTHPQEQIGWMTAGGLFAPGSHASGGQLPGTCSSYHTVQRGAQVAGRDGAGLVWLPLDAPLVMINAVDYGRWETGPYAWNGLLASMPVNHYWHTNFPTSQRGPLRLRYRIAPLGAGENAEDAFRTALPLDALGWR